MSPRKRLFLFVALFLIAFLLARSPGFAAGRKASAQLMAGVAVVIIGIAGLRGVKGKRPF